MTDGLLPPKHNGHAGLSHPDHDVNVPLAATYMEAWRGLPNGWKPDIESEGEAPAAES